MHISFIHEKGVKNINEDSILIGKNIFGVFDGADGMSKFKDSEGRTGGLLASTITKNVFAGNHQSLLNLAAKANNRIRSEMLKNNIDISNKDNLWCTNAAVVRLQKNQFEWFQVSDAVIIVIYADKTFEPIIDEVTHDDEILVSWKKFADQGTEDIRQRLDGKIKDVRIRINIAYGFLTGEAEAEKFFKSGIHSLDNIKHILVFTDGFFLPKQDSCAPDDWQMLVDFYLKGGLEYVRDYIRDKEANDLQCWKYPRTKVHDDMSAVAISF